ncbi:hypothetical protein F4553_008008 [Allocatelliglobosispora scoriae]|uniref:Uncharacterized protein n=1 Tax=Allocatelliglobosispora scoriae TaxID=643052 RepID=A0A841C2J2_9ACTN|nr:hypothetical protein [Allocatelliglobosispora scoriae]MBB5874574.1 hypothetical protein [Allocatelliglobosispora scoriae]
MSREDLHAMFEALAEDVPPPHLAGPAAAGAARVRRRRTVVAGALAAVVLISGAAVAAWRPTGADVTTGPTASPAPLPQPSALARVDRLPAEPARSPRSEPYWPASINLPARVPTLAEAPISHAVMLYSPIATGASAIYAYGEGTVNGGSGDGRFHWARVDVDLVDTRDAGGNQAMPLGVNSLGPMGTRAAFAQPDAAVIVDLLTGDVARIALPGLNEQVTWLADGRHVLVSSEAETWLVDVQTRSVVRAAVAGQRVTPLVGGGSGLTALIPADTGAEPLELLAYDDGGLARTGTVPVDSRTLGAYRISYLSPRGWRYGDLVAFAANGQLSTANGSGPRDFVAVLDARTGAFTQVLDLGERDRNKGCCAVYGWQNSNEVLVYTQQEGLLAWDLSTGRVVRLVDPALGLVSVAPMGCDWHLTIGGVSADCIQ